ncbi:DUF1588 domain-containing protein [Bremerella sp. JC770]|uniref:DUF1588 domain-containing protein n=1 Tax=Bremerella sp. JC770 TaxID=3232137 RepID=UPI0034588662
MTFQLQRETRRLANLLALALVLAVLPRPTVVADETTWPMLDTLKSACIDCHNQDYAEGSLNFDDLPWNLHEPENRERWVLVYDRISRGEMPPEPDDLSDELRAQLTDQLATQLVSVDRRDILQEGRGAFRRLTRDEFTNHLRDLLQLPKLDVKSYLPPDRERHHCNKVASTLDLSRVQLEAYLNATDVALRSAVASGVEPPASTSRKMWATSMFESSETFGNREAMFYAKDSRMIPLSGAGLASIRKNDQHDPSVELAIFRSASWPYFGYPDKFLAREAGEYQVRFSARAVRQIRDFQLRPALRPVPMTFRARKRSGPDVSGDVRATGGVIDVQPIEAVYETTIVLKENETFEYSLLGLPVPIVFADKRPIYYDFPPMPEGGHRGIAFQWLEITGPLSSPQWPPPSHRVLFDDLPVRSSHGNSSLPIELVSEQPRQDAARLLRRFIQNACQYPVAEPQIVPFEQLVFAELDRGSPLAEALLAGYRAFLCSGEFLFLSEPMPTRQTDEQYQVTVARRLACMLNNSRPDAPLMQHALDGELVRQAALSQEVDRLIDSAAFDRFIENFTDHWLGLKDIRRDEPDIRLYPEYRFDDYLIESLEWETRQFVKALFRDNLPASSLIDTDFCYANDRLSRHYQLQPLAGSHLRKVALPSGSPYGGLLTQGAVMKVTCNGTSTSPVIRGAWVMDRLLGNPPPPPPPQVPAVEPDIRGAKTIREQLALHTEDASCASCHKRFDPVGFALENYDIMGAWRSRYRSTSRGEKITGIDRAGHPYRYHVGEVVDASGQLLDGREFSDLKSLKKHLLEDPRPLARNLLHQWTLYATGTTVRISDRPVIESILDDCQVNDYRVRDLLRGLIQSSIFLGSESPRLTP